MNKRLETAMGELKEKHRSGTNEVDDEGKFHTCFAFDHLYIGTNAIFFCNGNSGKCET